jgi:hypothetical protein
VAAIESAGAVTTSPMPSRIYPRSEERGLAGSGKRFGPQDTAIAHLSRWSRPMPRHDPLYDNRLSAEFSAIMLLKSG